MRGRRAAVSGGTVRHDAAPSRGIVNRVLVDRDVAGEELLRRAAGRLGSHEQVRRSESWLLPGAGGTWVGCAMRLRDDPLHHLAVDVREAVVASAEEVGQLRV